MYSSYAKAPKSADQGKKQVATDHEALHRDATIHQAVQSSESHLTPLDLETIMSNKGVVKYWYLHRPKTMEIVHKNAVKVQSVARSFAVRSLIRKYGINYMVELAKRDAEKKEAERLAAMTPDERRREEEERIAFDLKVEETRRLKRQATALAEEKAAQELAEQARLAALAESERLAEEQRKRDEAEAAAAALAAEEAAKAAAALAAEEAAKAAAALAAEESAKAAAALAAEESAKAAAAQKALDDKAAAGTAAAAAITALPNAEVTKGAAWSNVDSKVHGNVDAAAAAAAVASTEAAHKAVLDEAAQLEREAEERELAHARALAEKAARERELALQAEKQAKYEDSLGRDVPIVVTDHGRGRVLFYDRETEVYSVAIEHYGKPEEVLDVYPEEIVLDGERILSPKTLVDTPFGVGEVVGLDPHLGCYAVTNLVVREEGVDETAAPQAFLQIRDIVRHVEERESHDVVVEAGGLPIPDEITMKSARIVNSKIVTQSRHKFVQYHLEIQTTNYGTVYCWKRYSTFRLLCDRLMNEAGYKKKEIPELPKRHITGNMSEKTIRERVEKLNEFLDAAVRAEHLQWGIKVDDQIAVYKRRVKKPRNAAPAPSSSVFGSRRR